MQRDMTGAGDFGAGIENGIGSLSEEQPDAVVERVAAGHLMRTGPHPDAAGRPDAVSAVDPDAALVTAWCTCLLWRSRLPWTAREHTDAFETHLARVRRAARILPPGLVDGRFAYLPCADEAAALAVAETWIDLGSARSRLFLDGSGVVIAFADVQFPTEVALWALRTDRTDPSAAYLLHALEYLAGPNRAD
ncbi:hypothetical protein [Embleya hyalina]|nr:hypothetical protein [Embleya hyalina]